METVEQKTERNCRVQARYDSLMREGKHGHYETMFRVVREEVERERQRQAAELEALRADAERWRTFLATRPASTHEVIRAAIDAARTGGGNG